MEWLAAMASLGERLAHALKTRGKKPAHLDRYLAERFGKQGTGTGYTHRVLKKNQRPNSDIASAIADFLEISEKWLLSGQGGMDPGAGATPTYDSLTGWAESAAEEQRRGRVQAYAIRAAGRSPAFVRPVQITADFVFRAAMFWLENAPEPDREAAIAAEAARLKAAEDTAGH
jgi:hypothetical protein